MKVIFILIALFLTSCLETYERKNIIQNVLVIPAKKDTSLFIIKKDLEEKFNLTENPIYNLSISAVKTSAAGGLTNEAYTTSFTVKLSVTFTLIENATKKKVYSGVVSRSSNYISEKQKLVAEKIGTNATFDLLAEKISEEIYDSIQDNIFNARGFN